MSQLVAGDPASTDTSTVTSAASAAWTRFDATTSRWGRATMLAAIVLTIAGPLALAVQLDVSPAAVLAAFLGIAAVFGVIWFVEPFSYFPILGSASMYQAFMIGNISNKLLPAAVGAQAAIRARPETERGQLAAVLAICGAATTHLLGLLVVVGVFGSLLVNLLAPDVIAIIQTYIVPAVMGAVIVQMISSNRSPRLLAIAAVVGALVVFVLTPLVPGVGPVSIGLSVVITILLAIFLPGRKPSTD